MIPRRAMLRQVRQLLIACACACAVVMFEETARWRPGAWASGARAALALCGIGIAATTVAMRYVDRVNGVHNFSGGANGRSSAFGSTGGADAEAGGANGTRATWNGSSWTTRSGSFGNNASVGAANETNVDKVQGTGAFGYGGYQDEVDYDDARARGERERAEQERWARWEAEDEERENRRASSRAEKKVEDRAKKEKSRAKRWARYDEQWELLESAASSGEPLRYDDVPWPPKMKELLDRESGGENASDRDRKLAYHRCVKRWHPDKFLSKFRARIELGGDADKIAERVGAVAKALTLAYGAA